MTTGALRRGIAAAGIAVLLAAVRLGPAYATTARNPHRRQRSRGVVKSANGPEAGVWVIAETSDLPTRFAKIVVTDDQGRYLMPDLPKASYSVWCAVTGWSIRPKSSHAGKRLDLSAVVAPSAAAAAEYTRRSTGTAAEDTGESEFPGTGIDGNGIDPA